MIHRGLLVRDSLHHFLAMRTIKVVIRHHLVVGIDIRLEVMIREVVRIEWNAPDGRTVSISSDIRAWSRRQELRQVNVETILVVFIGAFPYIGNLAVEGWSLEFRAHCSQVRVHQAPHGRVNDRGHQSADKRITLEGISEDILPLVRPQVIADSKQFVTFAREYLGKQLSSQPPSHAVKSLQINDRPEIVKDTRKQAPVIQAREPKSRGPVVILSIRLVEQFRQVVKGKGTGRHGNPKALSKGTEQGRCLSLYRGRYDHSGRFPITATLTHGCREVIKGDPVQPVLTVIQRPDTDICDTQFIRLGNIPVIILTRHVVELLYNDDVTLPERHIHPAVVRLQPYLASLGIIMIDLHHVREEAVGILTQQLGDNHLEDS